MLFDRLAAYLINGSVIGAIRQYVQPQNLLIALAGKFIPLPTVAGRPLLA
jgi:hypothetical protein